MTILIVFIMQAMIFAAGFGKRLLPLTRETPKALVEIKGRPILDWVVRYLMSCGVTEIILNTHYRHDTIISYLKAHPPPVPVVISHEPEILGTGGGFYRTRNFWRRSPFLLYNVDILCTADLAALTVRHQESQSPVTLAIHSRPSASMLLVDEQDRLVGIHRQDGPKILTEPRGSLKAVGFSGIHAVSEEIFSYLSPPVEFSIIDCYLRLVREGMPVHVWDMGRVYWEDIGTPQALRRAESDFPGSADEG